MSSSKLVVALGVVCGVVVLGALPASAQRIYYHTLQSGEVVITDSLHALPDDVRARLMADLNRKARRQFSAKKIAEMKAAGEWPPLSLLGDGNLEPIRSKAAPQGSVPFQVDGTNPTVLSEQKQAYRAEKARVESETQRIERKIKKMENKRMQAHLKDLVDFKLGSSDSHSAKLKAKQERLRGAHNDLKNARKALPQKRRAINMGEKAYTAD
jgi:hypothetical protein